MSPGAGVRRVCLLVLVLGVFAPYVLADGFASCQAGWGWANNSMKQNPCEIAGALEAACEGYSVYVLGPLDNGSNYVTPQRNSSSQKCQCNTVMFSLYMACTACQNATTQLWSFWSRFCDEAYVTEYPGTIPLGTAVPHWAYLNYTTEDKFDPATAKAAGGLPEELAPVPSTVSLSSTSPHSGSLSTMVGPTSMPGQGDDGQTKNSSNVGPIVGGVIGGLAVLAAIGVGTWIFLRKRANTQGGEDYSDYHRVSTGGPVSGHGHGVPPSPLRLYDPSDPSTFPTHNDHEASAPYTTASNMGHYTGAAEL